MLQICSYSGPAYIKTMKYIIMCGGTYSQWEKPRQLMKIGNETIVERTIRLLKENGVEDIYISANDPVFEDYAPVLYHHNRYRGDGSDNNGFWTDCFYPTDEPVCYIFGDVVFSPEAIRRIVEYKTSVIMMFASAPPFAPEFTKRFAEPFALKVMDQDYLKKSIKDTEEYYLQGKFKRKPIMWELWQVITRGKLNVIDSSTWIHINDYTCDVDNPGDLERIMEAMNESTGILRC